MLTPLDRADRLEMTLFDGEDHQRVVWVEQVNGNWRAYVPAPGVNQYQRFALFDVDSILELQQAVKLYPRHWHAGIKNGESSMFPQTAGRD